jgi:hypothetical protein
MPTLCKHLTLENRPCTHLIIATGTHCAAGHPVSVPPLRGPWCGRAAGPAGVLRYDERRRLTCHEGPLSRWELPAELHPDGTGATLTYHGDPGRWEAAGEHSVLSTVGRGQEFVVEATTEWQAWADFVREP